MPFQKQKDPVYDDRGNELVSHDLRTRDVVHFNPADTKMRYLNGMAGHDLRNRYDVAQEVTEGEGERKPKKEKAKTKKKSREAFNDFDLLSC
jgi:hypothetical protein